jgi:hypothetical protein
MMRPTEAVERRKPLRSAASRLGPEANGLGAGGAGSEIAERDLQLDLAAEPAPIELDADGPSSTVEFEGLAGQLAAAGTDTGAY